MTHLDHAVLEREARKLCEQVRGPGAWDKPGCHKNHWRDRVAVEMYQQTPSMADAFMSIFGFVRVKG